MMEIDLYSQPSKQAMNVENEILDDVVNDGLHEYDEDHPNDEATGGTTASISMRSYYQSLPASTSTTAEVLKQYAQLTSIAPGFVRKFFASSRLHHLSTWKADLSDYVHGIMTQPASQPPTSSNSSGGRIFKASPANEPHRVIMHIDMDCFFASVGIRDRPHLRGLPVAVAHSQDGIKLDFSSSEIASCNYEARAKGVKNGMFVGTVKATCPDLVIIPYEFTKYDQVSRELYAILIEHADYVQAVSCDEAYIDVTYQVKKMMQSVASSNDNISNGTSEGSAPTSRGLFKPQTTSTSVPKKFPQRKKRNSIDNDEDQELEEEEDDDEAFERRKMRMMPASSMMSSYTAKHSNPWSATHQGASNIGSSSSTTSLTVEQCALQIAAKIREAIFAKTKCPASIGVSHNLLLARIATAKAKPNGVYFLRTGDIVSTLSPLKIASLPGVGWSIAEKCETQLSLVTCGDIQQGKSSMTGQSSSSTSTLKQLQQVLGEKTGQMIYDFAHGHDTRVLMNKERQSLGSDINWGVRFQTLTQLDAFLSEFCDEVLQRLNQLQLSAGLVTVTIRKKLYAEEPSKFLGCGRCLDLTKSMPCSATQLVNPPSSSSKSSSSSHNGSLLGVVRQLVKEIAVPPEEIRGVGIHLKKLVNRNRSNSLLKSFFDKQPHNQALVQQDLGEAKKRDEHDPEDATVQTIYDKNQSMKQLDSELIVLDESESDIDSDRKSPVLIPTLSNASPNPDKKAERHSLATNADPSEPVKALASSIADSDQSTVPLDMNTCLSNNNEKIVDMPIISTATVTKPETSTSLHAAPHSPIKEERRVVTDPNAHGVLVSPKKRALQRQQDQLTKFLRTTSPLKSIPTTNHKKEEVNNNVSYANEKDNVLHNSQDSLISILSNDNETKKTSCILIDAIEELDHSNQDELLHEHSSNTIEVTHHNLDDNDDSQQMTRDSYATNHSMPSVNRFLDMVDESDEESQQDGVCSNTIGVQKIVSPSSSKIAIASNDIKPSSMGNSSAIATALNKSARRSDAVASKSTSMMPSSSANKTTTSSTNNKVKPSKSKVAGTSKITAFFKADQDKGNLSTEHVTDLTSPPTSPSRSTTAAISLYNELVKIPGMKAVLKDIDLDFVVALPPSMKQEQIEELKHRARAQYISPSKRK